MTLNDLERRNSFYFAFIYGIRQIFRPIISQWLKMTYNVRKILSPSSSLLLLAKTITLSIFFTFIFAVFLQYLMLFL